MFYKKIVKEPIRVTRRHWNVDGRGGLLEVLRCDDPEFLLGNFGQAYVTTILPGVIKAWHLHKRQTDRMILLRGLVRFGCVQGPAYEDVCLDLVVSDHDPYLITIPAGIYHGFKNIGKEEAYIINIPNTVYNREKPDEIRFPPTSLYDATKKCVVFDWDASLNG